MYMFVKSNRYCRRLVLLSAISRTLGCWIKSNLFVQANLIIPFHQARQKQLDSWQLGAKKGGEYAQKRLKLDQKNNELLTKIVFVARCDIHLEICPKILSLNWSIFGLITVGNSRALFLCYAAITPITTQSFQESTRRCFKHVELKSTPSIQIYI